MADLTRRPDNRPTRRQREQRAYQMVVAGGGAAAVAVVTGVLALVGVIGWSIPLLAVVVAVVCALLFRRAVGGS